MTPASVRDYLRTLRPRYLAAARASKHQILDEFCATADYNRKSAIRALNTPERRGPTTRGRPRQYGPDVQALLTTIWEAAGFPWSVRLQALLPLWLPRAMRRMTSPPPSRGNCGP